ncbi:MAG TPA: hypothetical protein VNO55_17665 [Polyangia bacterium]|nr:hypothetical protein [Polyangia bacterium]
MNHSKNCSARISRKPPHLVGLITGLVCAGFSPAAFGYRPFTGTDADVAERNAIELEIGPAGYLHAGPRSFLVAPSLIANWGFADHLELVLEGREFLPLTEVADQPRIQLLETQLDVKWLMREGALQEGTGPSVASEWTVLLPETGQHRPGAELAAIVSWRMPALTVHANGAVAYTREQSAGLFGGLLVEGPGAWRVRPVAEAFYDWDSAGAREISGLVGAIWPLQPSLALDAAVRTASVRDRDQRMTTVEVRAGFTWSFSAGRGAPAPATQNM